MEKEL